jgi:gliding motility-associated-like protein
LDPRQDWRNRVSLVSLYVMLRILTFFTWLMSLSASCLAQTNCVDGFVKMFPEPSVDYALNFGSSVSVHENFLAIGVSNSDTLARKSGIVYIYEKRAGGWVKIASMVASEALPDLELGVNVKLTENYLFASATLDGGRVYVFCKPASGWFTMTEHTVIKVEGTSAFGVAYHHPVDLSEDENTLVVTDAMKPHNSSPISIAGSIFIFHKQAHEEWSNSIDPVEIKATTDVVDFGRNGTYVRGNRIFAATPFTNSGHGNIFIYHDASGTFANPVLEATLSSATDASVWMDKMVLTDAGIFLPGSVVGKGLKIFFYPKPPSGGAWSSESPFCLIDPDGNTQTVHFDFIRLGVTQTGLIAMYTSGAGVSLSKLTEGASGWCDPSVDVIETQHSPRFGTLLEVGVLEDLVTGFVQHPVNGLSFSALKTYSNDGHTWASSLLYSKAQNTRNHGYGKAFAIHNNVMFVTAPFDNRVKDSGGRVYVYQRDATDLSWNLLSSIETPIEILTNREFGSSVAANGEYLAVGARLWSPSRILIYKKGSNGWANPQLAQQITIPFIDLNEMTYGESVVMNERWLLIPFVNSRGFSNMSVAAYELVDGIWTYRQALATGYFGLFTGTPNGGVAISGNTIVAGNRVYQLSDTGSWQQQCILSPSDAEGLRFNFPAFELISNGSNFGKSVAIRDNTIVIGSPRKDYQDVWDVGAVYVYTKAANEPWTNRTETAKIVPDEHDPSSLFGWSIAFADDALIIGAPTAQQFAKPDPNESPINNAQGKVYIYQPNSQQWKDFSLVKEYGGQTTFRDNFGIEVAFANDKIFIGASEEDIQTGRTSGTVYISDTPAIISAPPVLCSEGSPIVLTSNKSGGQWSGTGITNGNSGEFSPARAGAGVHQITYDGGLCLQTKINIRVSPRVQPEITGPNEVLVCPSSTVFSRTLSAVPIPDVSYNWYYKSQDNNAFELVAQEFKAQIAVTKRGVYKVHMFNEGCEGYSDTVTVRDESQEIVVDVPAEVCGTPPNGMSLSGSPSGGSWSGTGIKQDKFFIDEVPDGSYKLLYQYKSPVGCSYSKEAHISVKRIPTPVISRVGSLCESGAVSLETSVSPAADEEYIWSHQPLEGGAYNAVGTGGKYVATTWGLYKLSVRKGDCHASATKTVDDVLTVSLTPSEQKAELCYDHNVELKFPPDKGLEFQWYYSLDGTSAKQLPTYTNFLRPERTGYYTGVAHRGICSFTAPPKYFAIHVKDSVFVPNVFTPNGDGINDSFYVTYENPANDLTGGDLYYKPAYEIYNRYGRQVFAAMQNQPWDGFDAPSGVYFWLATYNTCYGKTKTLKGHVHLIK